MAAGRGSFFCARYESRMRSSGLLRPSTAVGSTGMRGFNGGSYAGFLKAKPSSHGRPSSIHCFSSATCSAGTRLPFGGICSSGSAERMALISALSALLPLTTTAPSSPPSIKEPRSLNENPPFFLSPAWHSAQCSRRMGTIWWEKSTAERAGRMEVRRKRNERRIR